MTVKVLKEVKNVGNRKFTKTFGVSVTLLDVIEHIESHGYSFRDSAGGQEFFVGTLQYSITVDGKDVNAEDIKIVLEDDGDSESSSFYDDKSGDEVDQEVIDELESLNSLSKDELIEKLLEERGVL